jgi:hypothetical protein
VKWRVAACALALCAAGRPAVAEACSVCGCGDPTLTVMGDEKPFRGRLRLDAEVLLGQSRVGTPGADEIDLTEERVEIAAAYAPTRALFLVLAVPMLDRQAMFHDGSISKTFTLGDIEARAKGFVSSVWRGAFHHQVAIQGGIKAPTGPVERYPSGAPLPAAVQPGMGAVTPFAGVFYGLGHGVWSFYASVTVYLPFAVLAAAHSSDSFRSSASVQRQVGKVFAARLGLDTRLDASGELNGISDPNSGGFIAYLSPGLVVSPVSDLLLSAGAHVPFAQALLGYHHEGTIASLGVTYDF